MTKNTIIPGHDFTGLGDSTTSEQNEAARVALGLPDHAQVIPLNVSDAALFVHVDMEGMATVNATIPPEAAAHALRQLASKWDGKPAYAPGDEPAA